MSTFTVLFSSFANAVIQTRFDVTLNFVNYRITEEEARPELDTTV